MSIDIFIRTYHRDIPFLEYALKSIKKFGSGYRDIIICIPISQSHLISHLEGIKVVLCPDFSNDYLGQQISKLEAHLYTDSDYILFTDSDTIFNQPFDLSEWFRDGKPILMKTHYSKVGDAICWQKIVEKALGFKPEYEYMRRQGLIYRGDDLGYLNSYFRHKNNGQYIADYIIKQEPNKFSEYNVLGAFIERFYPDKYCIIDTEKDDLPPNKINQYWSWGGLTPEIENEIKNILEL